MDIKHYLTALHNQIENLNPIKVRGFVKSVKGNIIECIGISNFDQNVKFSIQLVNGM